MKRILALVMLCLLLPVCALAQETITDKDGHVVALEGKSYTLGYVHSPYTMTTNGIHNENVEIYVSGYVELVLDGVQIDAADEAALSVFEDPNANGSGLSLTMAQGTVNTIRSTDTDPADDACSGLMANVALVVRGSGELDVQADGIAIEMIGENHLDIDGAAVKAIGRQGIHAHGGVSVQAGSLTVDSTERVKAIQGPAFCGADFVLIGRHEEEDAWELLYGEGDYQHVRSAEAVKVTYLDEQGSEIWTTKVGKGYGFQTSMRTAGIPEGKVFAGWKTPDGRTIEPGERMTIHEDTTLETVIIDGLSVIYEQYQGMPIGDAGLAPGEKYWVNLYYGKEPAGQVFSHWVTQDGEKLQVDETVRLTKSLTLTPVFVEAVELTWIYDDYNEPDVFSFPKGDVFYAREAFDSSEGVFTGWKVSDVDMTLKMHQSFIADRDLTFIAQYEETDMAKLTFLDKGERLAKYMPKGEENSISQEGRDGESMQRFLWWEDAAGNRYAADELITPMQDMTLTAKYGELGDERITFYTLDTLSGQRDELGFMTAGMSVHARQMMLNDGTPDYWRKIVAPDGRTYEENEILVLRSEHNGGTFKIYWEKLPEPVVIPVPPVILPDTGDSSLPLLWLGLMAASIASLIAMRRREA